MVWLCLLVVSVAQGKPACATLSPLLGRTLLLTPSACDNAPERKNCLVVPSHARHFPLLHRLLQNVRRFAVDAETTPTIAVLSGEVALELGRFCVAHSTSCDGGFEATDLNRLVELDAASHAVPHVAQRERVAHARATVRALQRINASALIGVGMAATFFQQALKKLLGAALTRCTRAWVVDSESTPLQPFSFTRIFDDYWAHPTVYYRVLAADSLRQMFLTHSSMALLGMQPSSVGHARHATFRLADYWHWSAAWVKVAMNAAVHANNASSFSQAFLAHPTHELLYYTWAHHQQHASPHNFVAVLPDANASSCYHAEGLLQFDVAAWPMQLSTHAACALLASTRMRAVRYSRVTSKSERRQPLEHTGRFWHALSTQCDVEGRVYEPRLPRSTEAAFSWWLSEAAVFNVSGPSAVWETTAVRASENTMPIICPPTFAASWWWWAPKAGASTPECKLPAGAEFGRADGLLVKIAARA